MDVLVVAACGYVFLTLRSLGSDRYLARDTGWELVYRSFAYGTINMGLAFVLWRGFAHFVPELAADVGAWCDVHVHNDVLALSALALPLAFVTARIAVSKPFVALRGALTAHYARASWPDEQAIIAPGAALWQTLYGLIGDIVLVSLENDKVYIGFLVAAERLQSVPFDERIFTVAPLKSGYRTEQTREVIYTTDYSDTDLRLHLFVRHITSIGRYDDAADSHFKARKKSASAS
jgi:hypothetical protein